MNQTLGFDVRMPIFSHETFGNSVDLQSKKVLSHLSHTPWAATYLKSGALSGVAIEQCASAHIHTLTDLDRLLKSILSAYEETDHAQIAGAVSHDGARATSPGEDRVPIATVSSAPDIALLPQDASEVESLHSARTAPRQGSAPPRTSGQSETDVAATHHRNGLPWAVREAFFCHDSLRSPSCRAVATAPPPANGTSQVDARTGGATHDAAPLASQPSEGERESIKTVEEEMDLEDDDAIDVVVSGMSSARRSRVTPRATQTPRTLASAPTAAAADITVAVARSTTSTAEPESPVREDAGRRTIPYKHNDAVTPGQASQTQDSECVSPSSSSSACSSATAAVAGATSDDAAAGPHTEPAAATHEKAVRHVALPANIENTHDPHHHRRPPHPHDSRALPSSSFYNATASQSAAPAARGPGMTPAELAGWLHLTVWTRCEIVSLLRELSGVQGYIAWSAWYWSYALKNPRYAMVHQALGSLTFWKRLFIDGFSSRLAYVHFVANQHMFQLKSAFQLLVSSIGALHGLLERMNSRLEEIQRQSERRSSAVAAVAAANATRCVTAAQSAYSLEELPCMAASSIDFPMLRRSLNRTMPPRSSSTSPQSGWTCGASAPSTSRAESDEERDGRGVSPTLQQSQSVTADGTWAGPTATAGAGGSLIGGAAAVISAVADDGVVLDYAMLEELRVTVLSTISNVLAVIRPQSVSSALARSKEAFSENATFERFVTGPGGVSELPSSRSSTDGSHNAHPAASPTAMGTGMPNAGAGAMRTTKSFFSHGTVSAGGDCVPAPAALGEDEPFYFASTAVPRRFGEYQVARALSLREGVAALLYCVQSSQLLLRELLQLVVVENRPPSTRHWARVLAGLTVVGPSFYWLYSKSPDQLASVAHKVGVTLKTLFTSYVAMPLAQIRDAVFYVRPGVEDRRRTLDRDAEALANIIRDYHENYYPTLPVARLDDIRDHTFQCFRDGVADEEGYGLIEKHYRDAVKHPIRSAFFGDLPRILLIQLSYQQLEVTRVVNGMDEVLEGNDLNFKIMAIMPVVGFIGLGTLWVLWRWRAQYKPMQMRMKQYWRAIARVVTFAEGKGFPVNVAPGALIGNVNSDIAPLSSTMGLDASMYGNGPAVATSSAFDSPRFASGGAGHTSYSGWQPIAPSQQERSMMCESEYWAQRLQKDLPSNQGVETCTAAEAVGGAGHNPNTIYSAATRGSPLRRPPHIAHAQPPGSPFCLGREGGGEEGGTRTPGALPNGPYPVAVPLASVTALNNYEQGTVLLLTHLMRSTAIWYLRRYPYYYELMSDLDDLESAQCTRQQRMRTLERMIITHDFLK